MRILKELQTGLLEVRILKDLRADDFGQNTAKHGVGLEVRILKELCEGMREAVEGRESWRFSFSGGSTPTPRQFVWLSKQRGYKMGSSELYENKADGKGQKRLKQVRTGLG